MCLGKWKQKKRINAQKHIWPYLENNHFKIKTKKTKFFRNWHVFRQTKFTERKKVYIYVRFDILKQYPHTFKFTQIFSSIFLGRDSETQKRDSTIRDFLYLKLIVKRTLCSSELNVLIKSMKEDSQYIHMPCFMFNQSKRKQFMCYLLLLLLEFFDHFSSNRMAFYRCT